MIVVILILGSFCYFSLFNLARSSNLFSGTVTQLYPTSVYATPDSIRFTPLAPASPSKDSSSVVVDDSAILVQLKQIVVTDPQRGNVLHKPTLQSVLQFQNVIENEVYVPDDASMASNSFIPRIYVTRPPTTKYASLLQLLTFGNMINSF
ncbi:unnamed protein product [Absidia cylindrospora]